MADLFCRILKYFIALGIILSIIPGIQAVQLSGGAIATSQGGSSIQGVSAADKSLEVATISGLGSGISYSNVYNSGNNRHSVSEIINSNSKAFTYTGSVSKGYTNVGVTRYFSVTNGYLQTSLTSKYTKPNGEWATSGLDLSLTGTGSGKLSSGSDENGRLNGGTYGPFRAYSNIFVGDFKGNINVNRFGTLPEKPYTPTVTGTNTNAWAKLLATNVNVVSTASNPYPITYQGQTTDASDIEKQYGAIFHIDNHIWFQGTADSAKVYTNSESLGTSAVAYSGWSSPGTGTLEVYSVTNNAKNSIGSLATHAIPNAFAKTTMVTDSENTQVVTFTSNSGLKLLTQPMKVGSGDISKFGISASSSVIYPATYKAYDSSLITGPEKLTATGIGTSMWNWNEATKAWNNLPNQYGMNVYYASIPVTWRFHAVDASNGATTQRLDSIAGDLNDDGTVTYQELLSTSGMYQRGEVTKAYIDNIGKS